MQKFRVEIWFDGMPMGSRIIEAEDGAEALKKAEHKTEHWILDEEDAVNALKLEFRQEP